MIIIILQLNNKQVFFYHICNVNCFSIFTSILIRNPSVWLCVVFMKLKKCFEAHNQDRNYPLRVGMVTLQSCMQLLRLIMSEEDWDAMISPVGGKGSWSIPSAGNTVEKNLWTDTSSFAFKFCSDCTIICRIWYHNKQKKLVPC